MAERALAGAGDPRLGEWRDWGDRVVHLRRRVSDAERRLAGGLVVRDIRGMPEERTRLEALLCDAPHLAPYIEALREQPR